MSTPLGSTSGAQRWAVSRVALQRRQTARLKRLLTPMKLASGALIQRRSSSDEPAHEGWSPWREIAPTYDAVGWVSAEHLDSDEVLVAKWDLPKRSRGYDLAIGYRGEVKVEWGDELVASLPQSNRIWIDDKILRLGRAERAQALTLTLSAGSEAVLRWVPVTRASQLPMWTRALKMMKRTPRSLSEDAIVALGLYAHLTDISDHDLLLPLLEVDRRWSEAPSLSLLLAFWGLSPPAVRAQVWSDYPLERVDPVKLKHAQADPRRLKRFDTLTQSRALFYQDLLVRRALSNLSHDRITEAAQDLHEATRRETQSAQTVSARVLLSQRLGMPHRGLALLERSLMGEESPDGRLVIERHLLRASLGEVMSTRAIEQLLTQAVKLLSDERGLNLGELQITLSALITLMQRAQVDKAARRAIKSGLWSRALKLITSGPGGYSYWSLVKSELDSSELSSQERSDLRRALIESAPIRAGSLYEELISARASSGVSRGQETATQTSPRLVLGGERILTSILKRSPADQSSDHAQKIRGSDAVELYHHVHYHLVDGRLTRTTRRIVRPQNPRGAKRLLKLSIPHSLGGQIFKLERAQHLRPSSDEDDSRLDRLPVPAQSRRDLSRPEDRMFYDLVAEDIHFEDVRPADLIDIQWSISELRADHENESLHADLLMLSGSLPRRCLFVTIGARAKQMLDYAVNLNGYELTTPCAIISQTPPQSDLIASFADIPHLSPVAQAPRGTSRAPYLHLSNLRQWSTLRSLYHDATRSLFEPHPLLTQTAKLWTRGVKAWSGQAEDRARYEREVIEALYVSLTQSVRYVGLEFGRHSYFPASPQQTLTRQSGDCKDRATLMISLAATLGVPLDFVMVRTTTSGALREQRLASLSAFDHAIIYSPTLSRYLDPTVSASDPWALPLPDQGAQALHVTFEAQRTPVRAKRKRALGASRPLERSQARTRQVRGDVLVYIPHPPAHSQGESWSITLRELADRGGAAQRGRSSTILEWTLSARGDPATQRRRALLTLEHPDHWLSARTYLPRFAALIPPQVHPHLKVDLAQRDPLRVHITDQHVLTGQRGQGDTVRERSDEPLHSRARLPSFTLSEQLGLRTSRRSTPLVITASMQERCIRDTRALTMERSAHVIKEWVKRRHAALPPSPIPGATAQLTHSGDKLCTRISLEAMLVQPDRYPQLSAWLGEVEHLLELNGVLSELSRL